MNWQDFDLLYFAGGHGAMWDFADDERMQALTRDMYEAGKVVAAVCHGTVALQNVQLSNGEYLIDGKNGTGLAYRDETIAGVRRFVPYNLEDRLKARGMRYSRAFLALGGHTVIDDRLITGQNPNSATETTKQALAALQTVSARARRMSHLVLAQFPCRAGQGQAFLHMLWSLPVAALVDAPVVPGSAVGTGLIKAAGQTADRCGEIHKGPRMGGDDGAGPRLLVDNHRLIDHRGVVPEVLGRRYHLKRGCGWTVVVGDTTSGQQTGVGQDQNTAQMPPMIADRAAATCSSR